MLACIKGFIKRKSLVINLVILQENPGLSFCDVTGITNLQTLFFSPSSTQHKKNLDLISSVFIHHNKWKKVLLVVFFSVHHFGPGKDYISNFGV